MPDVEPLRFPSREGRPIQQGKEKLALLIWTLQSLVGLLRWFKVRLTSVQREVTLLHGMYYQQHVLQKCSCFVLLLCLRLAEMNLKRQCITFWKIKVVMSSERPKKTTFKKRSNLRSNLILPSFTVSSKFEFRITNIGVKTKQET